MLGKTILDSIGWTEKLGGKIQPKIEPIVEMNTKRFEQFKEEINAFEKDPVQLDIYLKEHGLEQVEGLKDYILNNDIQRGSVNELIQTQNYQNIANHAHGILGVNTAIKEFNKLTDDASKSKLADTISNTNDKLGKYLSNLKDANGSYGQAKAGLIGYAGSLVTATLKTFALEAATMALNTAISFGISAVLSGIVSLFTQYSQDVDEAKEKTKELANEVAEEEENLVSLIAQYNKLDKTDRSTENTEQIKKLNEQINEALGDQADNIDLVNGKLDEQSDKLKRNLLQKLQDDKTQLDASVSVAKGDYDDGLDLGFTGIDFWGNIGEVLEKNGAKSVDGKFSVNKGNVDAILKSQDTETQIAQLKQWLEILNNADAKDGLGTYSDYIATLQDSLKKVEDKRSTLDKALERQMINQGEQDILLKPISNRKDFETYRNELSKTYKENDNVKNQLLDFIDTIYPDYAEKITETTDKLQDLNSQSSQPQTSSFSSIWNSKDYKSIKKKLESLNKKGKLTPETIKSVEDYKKMWKATGLSVKDFIRQIRQAATEQDKLSMFSKDTKKVTKAYKDFKKNSYVSSGSLNDMPDSFKNLDGYSNFNKKVRSKKTSAEQKQSAFNDLVTEYLQEYKIFEGIYKKFKDIQDKIDNAKSSGDSKSVEKYTKQFEKQQTKYATALRDAGVTNSDQLVQYFANNLNKQEELTKQSSAELNKLDSKDLANYVKTLNEKGKLSADSLSKIGTNTQTLINTLGTAYTTDVQNWMNALNDKAKAWNSFVKAVGSDGTKKDTESKYSSLASIAGNNTSTSPTEDRSDTQAYYRAKTAKNAYKKAADAAKAAEAVVDLDLKKVKGKFKVNYHPNTSTGDGTSKNGSSKNGSSKTKTEINWLERALTVLQKKLDTTASKLQNLFSVKDKNKNLDSQIKQIDKQVSAYDKVMQKYNKKMLQADKKNVFYKDEKKNDDIIKKIKNGKLSGKNLDDLISTYGEKRGKKINKYIEYYDNYLDAQQKKEEKLAEKREKREQKYQNYVDLYESRTSRAKAKEDIAIGATAKNKAVDTQIKNTKLSYDYQIKITKLTEDKAKADQLEYEKQKAIVDLKKQQIENLKTEYDNRIGLIDNSQQDANNKLSQMEARGQIIQSSYYSSLNNYENQKLSQLNSELSKLQAQQNTFTKYSQEWYDLQSDIQSVKNAINDAETAIIENNKKVGELRQAMYDDIASRNSNISTEASFLAGLLGDNLTDDKTGNFTKEGLAMLGTYAIDMESNTSTALSYKKDREELEKQISDYKNGNSHALDAYGSLDAAKKALDEIIQKQQDAISAEYANEKQIYDLMTQRYETQLSYMQSIIEARKKELDIEKD